MPPNKAVKTVFIGNKKVTFGDNNYVSAGGEGSVYRTGNLGVKIYHDQKHMIPAKKIQELSTITPDNVISPQSIVIDPKSNKPVGFSFRFIENSHPLCKIFTTKFINKSGLRPEDIADLVKVMQETIGQIHKEEFLIVDLNEMNFYFYGEYL